MKHLNQSRHSRDSGNPVNNVSRSDSKQLDPRLRGDDVSKFGALIVRMQLMQESPQLGVDVAWILTLCNGDDAFDDHRAIL